MFTKKILILVLFVIPFASIAQQKNKKNEKFIVFGNCEECKERIEKTLYIKGIYKSNWSIKTHYLTISYDSTKFTNKTIKQKLADVGHGSEGFVATDSVYDALPECCKYVEHHNHEHTEAETPIKSSITEELKDTIQKNLLSVIKDTTKPFIKITKDTLLDEVKVTSKNFSSQISAKAITNTLLLTQKELTKAACCNLSESFETSPSIDVSYTDAVTGIKQIQLLGLSGNYTQITTENVAELRGLTGSFGLTFIPSTFIEGIQVTKGVGSVANGFESIAGQINIEEKKPIGKEQLHFNAYANSLGRLESSLNLHKKINNTLSTSLLMHVNGVGTKNDINNDKFLDIPTGNQINFINRWWYQNENGLEVQLIAKALKDKRIAGDINYDEKADKFTTNKYGVGLGVEQFVLTGKVGYIFKDKISSFGFMWSVNNYNNNSYYGLRPYDAIQNSFYSNLIFQSQLDECGKHKYRLGVSFIHDNYNETYNYTNYKRTEKIPGSFVEYTFTPSEKFSAIVGLRADKHNEFGWFTTPRLHAKYVATKNTTIRFSAGSGFRMANIFAENMGYFISSRNYAITSNSNGFGYGLQPEKAWNFGLNISQKFKLNGHVGNISFDAYRTQFNNQTVVDVDANAQAINFYNLNGVSFSNSFQTEINYELFTKFDIRLAYRFLDVQTTFNTQTLEKPLLAKHRAFVNVAYETRNKWLFDATLQWIGSKRLPSTLSNPIHHQMPTISPSFVQVMAQITKKFSSKFDAYIGVENLTNFIQEENIVDHHQPFSNYFDASMVWGPTNGRIIYVGVRYNIPFAK